jgi:hypothetical protein
VRGTIEIAGAKKAIPLPPAAAQAIGVVRERCRYVLFLILAEMDFWGLSLIASDETSPNLDGEDSKVRITLIAYLSG